VYSSGAIGRLVSQDVIGLIRYLHEHPGQPIPLSEAIGGLPSRITREEGSACHAKQSMSMSDELQKESMPMGQPDQESMPIGQPDEDSL
jgi:hypothetical protein